MRSCFCYPLQHGACDFAVRKVCIHGYATDEVEVTVYIDEMKAGSLKFNTKDYERIPSVQRDHTSRAEADNRARLSSWPCLWANVYIPVDMSVAGSGQVHEIRIEACGAFKYDWFTVKRSGS